MLMTLPPEYCPTMVPAENKPAGVLSNYGASGE